MSNMEYNLENARLYLIDTYLRYTWFDDFDEWPEQSIAWLTHSSGCDCFECIEGLDYAAI